MVKKTLFLITLLVAAGGLNLWGSTSYTVYLTSSCTPGSPCTSITYSNGPTGYPFTGPAVQINNVNGIWSTLPDAAWISYANTGWTNTGPAANATVDFTVNYNLGLPTGDIVTGVTLNMLADDFAQVTAASPTPFGEMFPAVWDPQYVSGKFCSQAPPGCLTSTEYTVALNASDTAIFASDNQLTFQVGQLAASTPFGLAFNIAVQVASPTGIPEPASLSLMGLGLIAGSLALRRRRT